MVLGWQEWFSGLISTSVCLSTCMLLFFLFSMVGGGKGPASQGPFLIKAAHIWICED